MRLLLVEDLTAEERAEACAHLEHSEAGLRDVFLFKERGVWRELEAVRPRHVRTGVVSVSGSGRSEDRKTPTSGHANHEAAPCPAIPPSSSHSASTGGPEPAGVGAQPKETNNRPTDHASTPDRPGAGETASQPPRAGAGTLEGGHRRRCADGCRETDEVDGVSYCAKCGYFVSSKHRAPMDKAVGR